MKRILIILTAIFLASLNACSKPALRVMSYNIRCGNVSENNPENDWANRRPATPAMLREIAPDIFGVQEAYDFQIKYILDNCPNYSAVGVGRDDGKSEGEHMSVFYDTGKIDLLEWGTFWLSETPDIPSFGWDAAYRRTATRTMRLSANSTKS